MIYKIVLTLLFGYMVIGCTTPTPMLVPLTPSVKGIAIRPENDSAIKTLGSSEAILIVDKKKIDKLFSILEYYKDVAEKPRMVSYDHDYTILWKMIGEKEIDKSRVYLSLKHPQDLIYLSSPTPQSEPCKYLIRVSEDDANIIWNVIGITPPALSKN